MGHSWDTRPQKSAKNDNNAQLRYHNNILIYITIMCCRLSSLFANQGLENRRGATLREFESHSIRQFPAIFNVALLPHGTLAGHFGIKHHDKSRQFGLLCTYKRVKFKPNLNSKRLAQAA